MPTPEPPSRARQTPLSEPTLPRSIAVSGEKRWLSQLPPLVAQSRRGGATSASRVNAGATVIGGAAAFSAACTAPTHARRRALRSPNRANFGEPREYRAQRSGS